MDWDDAYANAAHIPGAADFPPRWAGEAQAYRTGLGSRHERLTYGAGPRNWADLFLPEGTPHGLAVFVHGGYWLRFDAATWSHLAAGAVARGWAVAMPCYTLCPDARISDITQEIAAAIGMLAERISGPIVLAGHSAGGHLVTRQVCEGSALGPVSDRIHRVLSISGVHDLRPLLETQMNATLGLDLAQANAESPALLRPRTKAPLICWVGQDERPEFVRQNALLANIWTGFGVATDVIEDPGLHHFNVIDALADPNSSMVTKWLE